MNVPLTTVSFFAGAGGLDIGLARAGWRTVAFSEISPYAIACFRTAHPEAIELGCIHTANGGPPHGHKGYRCLPDTEREHDADLRERERRARDEPNSSGPQSHTAGEPTSAIARADGLDWRQATLWTGGFPCQDLSTAGRRAGLAGERSGLAFAFLDLVERWRPRWFLLENVPGLLSSPPENPGADLYTLQRVVAELGYGMARRVFDARYFGVAQRRRRLFLLATRDPGGRAGAERAASVLHSAQGRGGHPAPDGEAGPDAADRFADGIGAHCVLPQAITAKWAKQSSGPSGDEHHNLVIGSLQAHHGRADADSAGGGHLVWGRTARAHAAEEGETWRDADIANTLNARDVGQGAVNELAATLDGQWAKGNAAVGDNLAPAVVPGPEADSGGMRALDGLAGRVHDPGPDLLPEGADSARYTVIGNGVVSDVTEHIGWSLWRELGA